MAEWISVKDRLPEVEAEVLVRAQWRCGDCIRSTVTTAMYEDGTVLEDGSRWEWDEIWEWGEYDEEKDKYRIPEGWWESNHYSSMDSYNNHIDDEVTHWMPLPKPLECPAEEIQPIDHSADVGKKAETRQSEFLKLFPNARIAVDGCIGGICPSDLDTEFVCPMQKRGSDYACCPECRRVYWHAEVKDNAD